VRFNLSRFFEPIGVFTFENYGASTLWLGVTGYLLNGFCWPYSGSGDEKRGAGTSGYMLNPLISPGSLEDFVELVIPELQKRGLYRTQPQSGTFRSRLRGDGSSHLPASAYGASFRFD